jgi:hypothetical protein
MLIPAVLMFRVAILSGTRRSWTQCKPKFDWTAERERGVFSMYQCMYNCICMYVYSVQRLCHVFHLAFYRAPLVAAGWGKLAEYIVDFFYLIDKRLDRIHHARSLTTTTGWPHRQALKA